MKSVPNSNLPFRAALPPGDWNPGEKKNSFSQVLPMYAGVCNPWYLLLPDEDARDSSRGDDTTHIPILSLYRHFHSGFVAVVFSCLSSGPQTPRSTHLYPTNMSGSSWQSQKKWTFSPIHQTRLGDPQSHSHWFPRFPAWVLCLAIRF